MLVSLRIEAESSLAFSKAPLPDGSSQPLQTRGFSTRTAPANKHFKRTNTGKPCWTEQACEHAAVESGRSGFDVRHSIGISEMRVSATASQRKRVRLTPSGWNTRTNYTPFWIQNKKLLSERITNVVKSWITNPKHNWHSIWNTKHHLRIYKMWKQYAPISKASDVYLS